MRARRQGRKIRVPFSHSLRGKVTHPGARLTAKGRLRRTARSELRIMAGVAYSFRGKLGLSPASPKPFRGFRSEVPVASGKTIDLACYQLSADRVG